MQPRRRRGMLLLVVLVVVALCSLAAATFSQLMLAEREAAELSVRKAQALALTESGLETARFLLSLTPEMQSQAGGWYDNPFSLRGVLVADSETARRRGRFTIVAPRVENGYFSGIRFGLEDESCRVNLNALAELDRKVPGSGRSILMALPGMTEEIADAILDWLDPDDEPREFGAELETYSLLYPPYAPKNGKLDTLEELLLVRGVTPTLLFGVDANRNGVADRGEPAPETIPEVDNTDRTMDRGWSAYLTLYSLEANVQPDGTPRINLNQEDMQALFDALEPVLGTEWATFIVAYRQNGPYNPSGGGSPKPGNQPAKPASGSAASGQLDLTQKGKYQLKSVLDLIGVRTQAKFVGSDQPTVLESPFPDMPGLVNLYLPKLLDHVTATRSEVIPGRININQAPRIVLEGIPGMTPEIVDQIIARRQPDPVQREPEHRHETWIYAEGMVTLEQMKALMPFVTGGGCVYRAQVVGYFDAEGPDTRIEAIVYAGKLPARVIFWRDMSHLGRGYPLETLGVDWYGLE
ncbi:MAG: hypothetical protein ACUVUC_07125 [Thermoguttaceae bacterium]